MKKYEYKIISTDSLSPVSLLSDLNDSGEDGWELISVIITLGDRIRHYLRREKKA